jgi:hypothetical protein
LVVPALYALWFRVPDEERAPASATRWEEEMLHPAPAHLRIAAE